MAIRFCMGTLMANNNTPSILLDSNVFKNAKRLLASTSGIEYIQIADTNGKNICYCYDDKHGDSYLIHIQNMQSSTYAKLFFKKIKYINIYSLNELSYEFYILCKDAGCKINLYGDLWEYITPVLVEHSYSDGFKLYSEGNPGFPVKEMGEWKNVFPHNEYVNVEKIYSKLHSEGRLYNNSIKTHSEANRNISELIRTGTPFMASRLGNTESRVAQEFLCGRVSDYWISWLYKTSGFYSENNRIILDDVHKYIELTIESIKKCDINLCRFENSIKLQNIYSCSNTINVDWYDLYTSIDHPNFWLRSLSGKKILIISSINASIKAQINNFPLIHNTNYSLSNSIIYYDCPETYFIEERKLSTWFDTFNKIKSDISNIEFDVAIISAGAYGHPLAAYVKTMGKQSINICSGIYVLFGIKNKAQTVIRRISSNYNDYWIYPIKNVNRHYMDIEKGGYWG